MTRVLYLHGYGESALVCQMAAYSLKTALERAGIELLAPKNAFIKLASPSDFAPIVDAEYRKMCQSGDLEAFCWYPLRDVKQSVMGHRKAPATDFSFRGDRNEQDEAVRKLCTLIDEQGGIDAIVGFSQGGELAYLVAEALPQLRTANRLRFIATFGAEDVFLQRGVPPVSKVPNSLRFFICYGDGDDDAVVDSATTKDALEQAGAASVVTHRVAGLDHRMPKEGDGAYTAMLQHLKDAIQGKPVVNAKAQATGGGDRGAGSAEPAKAVVQKTPVVTPPMSQVASLDISDAHSRPPIANGGSSSSSRGGGGMTLAGVLSEAGCSAYAETLKSQALDDWVRRLEESRPTFLKMLQELGVAKLPERQAIANKLSKAKREGRL